MLGEYWASRNIAFDRVYSGPRVRQIETAKIVTGIYRRRGVALPETVIMQEFDEYQGEEVLKKSVPELTKTDARIRQLHSEFQRAETSEEKRKTFQRMFEAVVGKWIDGEIPLRDVESWPDFCARVNRGLSQLTSSSMRGERVVDLYLRRADRRSDATRPESFSARCAAGHMDVFELLLQRVSRAPASVSR